MCPNCDPLEAAGTCFGVVLTLTVGLQKVFNRKLHAILGFARSLRWNIWPDLGFFSFVCLGFSNVACGMSTGWLHWPRVGGSGWPGPSSSGQGSARSSGRGRRGEKPPTKWPGEEWSTNSRHTCCFTKSVICIWSRTCFKSNLQKCQCPQGAWLGCGC